MSQSMADTNISHLSDDIVLNIFLKVESDPRNWACLACVSTKFSTLIRTVCYKNKCTQLIPTVVSDLISGSIPAQSDPPGGWAALHKLSVCCPGLLRAGILLENSDFGLEREIGSDENYSNALVHPPPPPQPQPQPQPPLVNPVNSAPPSDDGRWSLFDDLYFDTLYDNSESCDTAMDGLEPVVGDSGSNFGLTIKRSKQCGPVGSHLASRVWNLSREQGNKLLASRFRGDCLYICDWPGCTHDEEKRNYMLFRGVFKNFKRSRVWRAIKDANRGKIALDCAFCSCKETWDLHSAFCLRRVYGYHDDGEPVVRAYVCENGHVSGAWTERPMYT